MRDGGEDVEEVVHQEMRDGGEDVEEVVHQQGHFGIEKISKRCDVDLQLLPIPTHCWKDISFNSIFVIIDRPGRTYRWILRRIAISTN